VIYRRTGRIMNADLAEYHVPVNAEAPLVEAIPVHEDDPHINALGVKGVGEIGITGTVGAIANAVWHATGVRVRRFLIHVEDVGGIESNNGRSGRPAGHDGDRNKRVDRFAALIEGCPFDTGDPLRF